MVCAVSIAWVRCGSVAVFVAVADAALHRRCVAAVTPAAASPSSALTKVTILGHVGPNLAGTLPLDWELGAREGTGESICQNSRLSTLCREF